MTEEALVFGRRGNLVGVITNPDSGPGAQTRTAVILLNAGLVYRVGPNRLYVRLARQLASMGLVVLRFDFGGIGDSQASVEGQRHQQRAIAETRQAMDVLSKKTGVTQFVLMGICSGAVNSLQTAMRDPRVIGAILVNGRGPLTAKMQSRRESTYYWSIALTNPKSWLKVFKGAADYRDIARAVTFRLKSFFFRQEELPPHAGALASAVQELAKRQVHLLAVFSVGDPGLDYLRISMGKLLRGLQASGAIQVEVVNTRSHTFLLKASQQRLITVLGDWLKAHVGGL